MGYHRLTYTADLKPYYQTFHKEPMDRGNPSIWSTSKRKQLTKSLEEHQKSVDSDPWRLRHADLGFHRRLRHPTTVAPLSQQRTVSLFNGKTRRIYKKCSMT